MQQRRTGNSKRGVRLGRHDTTCATRRKRKERKTKRVKTRTEKGSDEKGKRSGERRKRRGKRYIRVYTCVSHLVDWIVLFSCEMGWSRVDEAQTATPTIGENDANTEQTNGSERRERKRTQRETRKDERRTNEGRHTMIRPNQTAKPKPTKRN